MKFEAEIHMEFFLGESWSHNFFGVKDLVRLGIGLNCSGNIFSLNASLA